MCNKRETLEHNDEPDFNIKPLKESEIPPEWDTFDRENRRLQNFIFLLIVGPACAFYYFFYLIPFGHISPWILPFGIIHGFLTVGIGITVGAHRYWTHKTFKANKAMQILLMLQQTSSIQFPIYHWVRNHRVHHKYTDTNADPHNAKRGFWFSHVGWLILPTHPDVIKATNSVDMSDIASDPVVRFQTKYYWELVLLTAFILPIPLYNYMFPDMTLVQHIAGAFARYIVGAHSTFLVNSYAHLWGSRPYDKHISASETTLVALLSLGEGWHNYHHTFPWDYKSAELGAGFYNLSTAYINFFAKIGWVWDMKTVSHKLLQDRINRTGDKSHPLHRHHGKSPAEIEQDEEGKYSEETIAEAGCWGWGDKDINKEDIKITQILCPKTS